MKAAHEQCRCNKEAAAEEKQELKAAKAQVTKYEVETKVRVWAEESIGGSNASLDTKVALVGVETKVSESGVFVTWPDFFIS